MADAIRGRGRGECLEGNCPGNHWEYNDVRINRLSLALLRVFGRPLPDVLREAVMEPIGASDTWSWHGYETSTVLVDGEPVESVSGGGHWGGGLWLSTRDLARVGLLLANGGAWDGEQVVPGAWIERMTTPCEVQPTYGYLTWLDTERELWPDARASSFAALGFGSNVVWVAPEQGLVAVLRWLRMADDGRPHQNAVLGRLAGAVE
jgi:CubicO group peptidase (beta-lactamase class C family)